MNCFLCGEPANVIVLAPWHGLIAGVPACSFQCVESLRARDKEWWRDRFDPAQRRPMGEIATCVNCGVDTVPDPTQNPQRCLACDGTQFVLHPQPR